MRARRARQLAIVLGLAGLLVGLAHPLASAGSDIWGNIGPASPLGSGGLFERYPVDHYVLDEHFTAVSASLTGGVNVDGLLPMIAYFLATLVWLATSFLANLLVTLFGFAFSLDLLNGSEATGGAGALAPVSAAIHSIYANVFGAPWLVLAIAAVGIWAMWKALVQRRYSETAGALALSLIYIVIALFFVAQPGQTIGTASGWTNQMSAAFLAISSHGTPSNGDQAKDEDANQLFELLVFKPWTVLEFGGLEHCALSGTGSNNSDPASAPVRPLSTSPTRDAELARRLQAGEEVSADGKVCVNNANKYASHFLHFGLGTDERSEEYDALNHGDSSKLPEADSEKAGYKLGVADKPATDAMEEGGQYERLLLSVLIFFGELGAFLLLGSLSIGVILAQVLLLLLLAFAPVALVAAAIPGRGHDFFKGWLQKLAGYLLRKAAYSLILAILLAVNGALTGATAQLGWLMSFSLQGLFFWAVFVQRKALTDGLIGIATRPGTPGRDGAVRVLALYAGARTVARPLRGVRRAAGSARRAPGRVAGMASRSRPEAQGPASVSSSTPRSGTSCSAPVGGGAPSVDLPGPTERSQAPAKTAKGAPAPKEGPPAPKKPAAPTKAEPGAGEGVSREARGAPETSRPSDPKQAVRFPHRRQSETSSERRQPVNAVREPNGRGKRAERKDAGAAPSNRPSPRKSDPVSPKASAPQKGAAPRKGSAVSPGAAASAGNSERSGLSGELREERERAQKAAVQKPARPTRKADLDSGGPTSPPKDSGEPTSPPRRRHRKKGTR